MKRIYLTLIVFAVFVAFGVQAQESRNTIIETWRCFAEADYLQETVLVELTRETLEGVASGFGEISVAGLTYSAMFSVAGFDRRWDFGEELNYTFLIEPSGSGRYYDFSSVEDGGKTTPSQLFNCVSP